MIFEHIYGVASFIVMLIVLLCVFQMYLALTATCRNHRAFLLESATREEQERVNRARRELGNGFMITVTNIEALSDH